eukprot:scaffold91892_cov26-Tisochrysis_lutea.AAC.5
MPLSFGGPSGAVHALCEPSSRGVVRANSESLPGACDARAVSSGMGGGLPLETTSIVEAERRRGGRDEAGGWKRPCIGLAHLALLRLICDCGSSGALIWTPASLPVSHLVAGSSAGLFASPPAPSSAVVASASPADSTSERTLRNSWAPT